MKYWTLAILVLGALHGSVAGQGGKTDKEVINEILANQELTSRIVRAMGLRLGALQARAHGQDKTVNELITSLEVAKSVLRKHDQLLASVGRGNGSVETELHHLKEVILSIESRMNSIERETIDRYNGLDRRVQVLERQVTELRAAKANSEYHSYTTSQRSEPNPIPPGALVGFASPAGMISTIGLSLGSSQGIGIGQRIQLFNAATGQYLTAIQITAVGRDSAKGRLLDGGSVDQIGANQPVFVKIAKR